MVRKNDVYFSRKDTYQIKIVAGIDVARRDKTDMNLAGARCAHMFVARQLDKIHVELWIKFPELAHADRDWRWNIPFAADIELSGCLLADLPGFGDCIVQNFEELVGLVQEILSGLGTLDT